MSRSAPKPSFLDDYVGVNVRVGQFHEKYPNGRIVTRYELVDDNRVIFHTAVYRDREDAEPSATGTAIDIINIPNSTFEKVETASVGRALAFLNFEAKAGIASREEMEKSGRSGPRAVPEKVDPSPSGWRCNTNNQKMLENRIKRLGDKRVSSDEVVGIIERTAGVRDAKLVEDGDVMKVVAAMDQRLR